MRWSAYGKTVTKKTLCRHTPKVGAVCPNWARTDLCGGRSVMSVPTAISETSAQIIPLKGRADFRGSSRILATETIRVRAVDSFGVFGASQTILIVARASGPGAPEAPPGVAPSHVGPPQAASRFQRARRVSSATGL